MKVNFTRDLSIADEEKVAAAVKDSFLSMPPSEHADALHCINELRRMITLKGPAGVRAIVIMAKSLSLAKVIEDKVIVMPGGNLRG